MCDHSATGWKSNRHIFEHKTMEERQQSPRKRILITGASRGIGYAACVKLASEGYDLVCWSRSPMPDGGVASGAGEIVHQRVDVADAGAVVSAYAELAARGLTLDGVVINAGIGRWKPLRALDEQEWRQTLSVNLDGAFHVLRGALAAFDASRNPIVVGLLSDTALYAFAERAAYASSKAGLKALLETARREERVRGVRFSLIYPSRVDTHFAGSQEAGYPGLRPDGLDAGNVADMIAFLLSQPPNVEIREVHMAALSDGFGPYNERKAKQ
jgi:NAD(P)-dependent dehydrogenase (short-subunit alcohol dehydrogenase family)